MSYAELAKLIVDVGSPDNFKDVGALKVFKIPAGGPEGAKAYGRLETEVNALSSIQHSAVLKLLHHNRQKNFIVTEFHPQGTLNSHLIRYKGRALEALLRSGPLSKVLFASTAKERFTETLRPRIFSSQLTGGWSLGILGSCSLRTSSALA